MSVEQFGYRQQLQRALTTRDLIVYGMIFMVPIAPFAIFGFVWHDARGMVALAYVIGLIGMLFTALSYAAMSRAFPLAGSVYTYARRGLSEIAGFFSGWLILLDYILVPALLYLFSAVALRPLLPRVPAWAWLVAFIALNGCANVIGIRFTARLYAAMLILELLVLALFVGCGLLALHAGAGAGALTLQPLYDPHAFSLATVVGATSIAVLSFLGFDGISTHSEEAVGGQDTVGRATIGALLLTGALFIAQTWVATDLSVGLKFSAPETAFYDVALRAGGTWLRLGVIVATVLANIANAMAAQAAVSRVLFAMARDGKLPLVLASVHSRYRTPHVSTLVVSGVSLLVGLSFAAHLDNLTSVVNFGALTSFVLLHLSVIRHYLLRERSGRWLRHLVCPALGLIVILYVLFQMDRSAKLLGVCWIVIGALYYFGFAAARRSPAPQP